MLSRWYVKELSSMTGVSVQTLHYYDRTSLLKPSLRQDNGYRLYSEADLQKLQQIIALKFFNFELKDIQKLLSKPKLDSFIISQQDNILKEKSKRYLDASNTLNIILRDVDGSESMNWEKIIQTI